MPGDRQMEKETPARVPDKGGFRDGAGPAEKVRPSLPQRLPGLFEFSLGGNSNSAIMKFRIPRSDLQFIGKDLPFPEGLLAEKMEPFTSTPEEEHPCCISAPLWRGRPIF
jgi:hypothetical protein